MENLVMVGNGKIYSLFDTECVGALKEVKNTTLILNKEEFNLGKMAIRELIKLIKEGNTSNMNTFLGYVESDMFDDKELRELAKGIRAGIDTTLYKDCKDYKDMRIIRELLESDINDINLGLNCIKKGLEIHQIEEVYEGSKAGINTDIYTNKKLSKRNMFKFRKMLENGIDEKIVRKKVLKRIARIDRLKEYGIKNENFLNNILSLKDNNYNNESDLMNTLNNMINSLDSNLKIKAKRFNKYIKLYLSKTVDYTNEIEIYFETNDNGTHLYDIDTIEYDANHYSDIAFNIEQIEDDMLNVSDRFIRFE